MLRALIFSSGDRGYVLAGTVPLEVLESMAQELVDNPPDRSAP
jgi:predicted DNA-binding transcriptional regulator